MFLSVSVVTLITLSSLYSHYKKTSQNKRKGVGQRPKTSGQNESNRGRKMVIPRRGEGLAAVFGS